MHEQLTIEAVLKNSEPAALAEASPSFLQETEQRPLYKVALAELVIDKKFNRREDFGDVEDLAGSIELLDRMPGIFKGFAGPDEKIYLTDGFRRLEALQSLHRQEKCLHISHIWLDLEEVPLTDDSDDLLLAFLSTQVIANQGLRFNQFEQARIFKDMERLGYAKNVIAKACGVSPSTITERLQLLTAKEETIKFAKDEGVSPSALVMAVRRGETPDEVDKIVRSATTAAGRENRKPSKEDIELAAQRVMVPSPEQLAAFATDELKSPSIMHLFEDGYSMPEIQRRLRVAWSTVNRVVSAHRREHQFDWLLAQGIDARRPPIDYYTNYDWARDCCSLSRDSASKLLGMGADEIEAVETLQKKPTEISIRRMTIVYGRWLPGLSSDHLLGIKDFKNFLNSLHKQSVIQSAAWST